MIEAQQANRLDQYSQDWRYSVVFSLITAALIAVYGGRVCPVIQAAPLSDWVTFLFAAFLAMAALRGFLLRGILRKHSGDLLPRLQFYLDLTLYALTALGCGIYPVLAYGSPPANGFKVLVAVLAAGFFFSLDLALRRERSVIDEACRQGIAWRLDSRYFPITRKFAYVAGACVIFTGALVTGVVIKDIHTNIAGGSGPDYWARAMYWAGIDVGFVILAVIGFAILVISSFARNLRLFFSYQTRAMDAVAGGDLAAHVPVASNDEFGRIAQRTNLMIEALAQRARELELTQDATIVTLASLAETRDNETGAHILRTQRYVRALADHLKRRPKYAGYLTPQAIESLYKSAPLHDVGKVGVPDAILLKAGRHTAAEFEEMKKHTVYGRDSLLAAEKMLGRNSFLQLAQEIAYTHHEKWDGSGYPQGLPGEAIPLSGRLMAVADVYDALISKRVYKPAFPHEKARQIILEGSGSHFDPEVVAAFQAVEEEFLSIAAAFADHAETTPILTSR